MPLANKRAFQFAKRYEHFSTQSRVFKALGYPSIFDMSSYAMLERPLDSWISISIFRDALCDYRKDLFKMHSIFFHGCALRYLHPAQ